MPEAKLNVVLLRHTPNPEKLVAQSAKLCYSATSINELQEQIDSNDQASFIEKLADMCHFSPFEHISFTFGIEGISRALSHQLVRHRVGCSFSQQSQRYVNFENDEGDFDYIIPESIKKAGMDYDFVQKMKEVQNYYNNLVKHHNIPPEDSRYILPNACETKIVVTMNARELLHFFQVRCCQRSQWEIRSMATEMLKLIKQVSPTIFKNSGPSCVNDKCHEGKMSCGKMVEVREGFANL
ncbi:MAG: FAD-dependent thymidylate synthase [Bacteroidia bacterium]|nr:FAD-dependent thymidylate synthase [Bacteroidia bacterium]